MKSPKSLDKLLGSFAKRHHIGGQLLASQVVGEAQRRLLELVAGSPLADEMLVESYRDGSLTFACRSSGAVYDGQGVAAQVAKDMEAVFPSQTIRAQCRLKPDVWRGEV